MLEQYAKTDKYHLSSYLLTALIIAMLVIFSGLPSSAQEILQKKFASPESAGSALISAAKNNDTRELLAIFGPAGRDIVSSGDEIADRKDRERYVKAAGEKISYSKLNDQAVLLVVGKDELVFPVPIIKSGNEWVFFTEEGRQEILNRRIGANELNAIQVCRAYVDAQREYAVFKRNTDGESAYARLIVSREGEKDGLYWFSAPGKKMSPMGDLFARAAAEGYPAGKTKSKPVPYHGYYYRILEKQGDHAPGGEFDYVTGGRMKAGFALVAYPAEHGVSGIMTFIVNHLGIVYQKDLGSGTAETVKAMTKYDPDSTWRQVQP